jgi:Contractile injection system tape measure protein
MGDAAVVTIRRQVLDVDLPGTEADGLALQRRLPGMCADVLWPAIEAVLGAIDQGDSYVYLDRLAIDLTLHSIDGFESELADAVQRELQDHFRRHPLRRAAPSGAAGDPGEPPSPGAPGEPGTPGDVQHRTFGQTVNQALYTFLRTGRLPWSFRLTPGRTLEQMVQDAWHDALGRRDPPPAIRQQLLTVLTLPEARERLAIQFAAGFALAVLRSLSPDVAALLTQIEAALGGASPASPTARAFTRQVRVNAIEAAAAGRRPRPHSLVRSAWTTLSPAGRADRTLAAALEREWPGSTRAGSAPVPVLAEPAPARPATPEGGETGGLLVDYAGIVLLHPFLPRFFERLGIAAGGELMDPSRALCLLHHLATGDLTAPEHRVTLAKALCGLPLEQPVEADVGLTDAETAEATALLEAAIRHWEALRSTTPDGLRAEFLQRPGVLSLTSDGDWLLQVETRTADILLDQLPWGFSPVWLPWMSHLMMVEWR